MKPYKNYYRIHTYNYEMKPKKTVNMKTQIKLLTAVATLGIAITFSSCQKEKIDTPVTSKATASMALTDLANNESDAAMDAADQSFKNEGCATVTRDMTVMPHVLTIDYGTSGCVGRDGKRRQGQVVITFDAASFETPGVNIVTSYNNYFVGGKQISGSMTKHNNGLNSNHNLAFTVTSNIQVFDPNANTTASENVNQVFEFVDGSGTLAKSDDVYSITGSSTGIDNSGNMYAESITSPIIKKRDPGCSLFFVQGIIVNQTANQPVKSIDYGNGSCDNLANVTVNGVTTTVTLQ